MAQLKDTSIFGDCKISGVMTVKELMESLNKSIFYTNWSTDWYTDTADKNCIITNSPDNRTGAALTIKSMNSAASPRGWGLVASSIDSSLGDGNFGLYNNDRKKFLFKVDISGNMFAGPDSRDKVWTSGNDGSGTGLDADLLDGKHASEFLLLTGGTMTGKLRFTGEAEILIEGNYKGISWRRNTDGADIYFKNDSDGDTDSFLCFQTLDNGNEYFKWVMKNGDVTHEKMRLNMEGLTVTGNVRATKIFGAVYNDYAEYFEKADEIEPGDVVELDIDSDKEVYIKSTDEFSKTVVGVCSDEYFQCIGGNGDKDDEKNFTPIGLSGRVRVKVVGKVNKGDFLVSSNIPGVAKAVEDAPPGTIIGKALENKTTEKISRVRMLIQLH